MQGFCFKHVFTRKICYAYLLNKHENKLLLAFFKTTCFDLVHINSVVCVTNFYFVKEQHLGIQIKIDNRNNYKYKSCIKNKTFSTVLIVVTNLQMSEVGSQNQKLLIIPAQKIFF